MKKIAIFILIINSIYASGFDSYLVKKGDTLNKIALEKNIDIDKLIELNDIKNPDLIYPGTILSIGKSSEQLFKYRVKKNDNLWKISKKFGISMEKIIELNNIKNPNLIYPGMKLKVYSEVSSLGLEYEKRGDEIWVSKNGILNEKIHKSLNNYIIAKHLYNKSEIELNEEIDKKIMRLIVLKEALSLENLGKIYSIKNEKEKANKKYLEALEKIENYKKLDGIIEQNLATKINNMKTFVLKKGEEYEKSI